MEGFISFLYVLFHSKRDGGCRERPGVPADAASCGKTIAHPMWNEGLVRTLSGPAVTRGVRVFASHARAQPSLRFASAE